MIHIQLKEKTVMTDNYSIFEVTYCSIKSKLFITLVLVFSIVIQCLCFASGYADIDLPTPRFHGMISKTVETRYRYSDQSFTDRSSEPTIESKWTYTTNYKKITANLYIVEQIFITEQKYYDDYWLEYNISMNNDISYLLSIAEIPVDAIGKIIDAVEKGTGSIALNTGETSIPYDQTPTEFNTKLVLTFNDDRIVSKEIYNLDANEVFEYYNYNYDHDDKLCSIIVTLPDGAKVVRKQFYYDGIDRTLPRPYFHDILHPNTNEILVFSNNKINQRATLAYKPAISYDRAYRHYTMQELEEQYACRLFYYDENGDETMQCLYYDDDNKKNFYSSSTYPKYDSTGNWTERLVSDNQLTDKVTRVITYSDTP
jgi:hypothetical protein